MQRNVRVHIAGAGRHYYAGRRRVTHCRIHAFTVFNGCYGCAAAQMATDEAPFVPDYFFSLFGRIVMRGAVKSITAELIFFIIFAWYSVKICRFFHTLMICAVKRCHLQYARKQRGGCFQPVHKCRPVQRQQRYGIINFLHYIFVYHDRAVKIFAAVPHSVADSCQLGRIFYVTAGEIIQYCLNGIFVVFYL